MCVNKSFLNTLISFLITGNIFSCCFPTWSTSIVFSMFFLLKEVCKFHLSCLPGFREMQSPSAARAHSLQPERRCWDLLTSSCCLPNSSNPAPETPYLYFPAARISLHHFHTYWMWNTSSLPPAHFPSPPDFPGSGILSCSVSLTRVMGDGVFAFSRVRAWSKKESFNSPACTDCTRDSPG